MKTSAIVLSAGTGSRMKSDIPKQYMLLEGKPVLYYSLKAFEDSCVDRVILVCGDSDREYCRREIIEKYGLKKVTRIVAGGSERYLSVWKGLSALDTFADADPVLIHDGARPMLTQKMINNCISALTDGKENSVVLSVPAKDTIRIADPAGYGVETPDRKTLFQMQTPQAFPIVMLKNAYERLLADFSAGKTMPAVTDDAMVMEYAFGIHPKLIPGDYRNIKITTPEDLEIARIFLRENER